MKKVVLLDRDGTINIDHGYVHRIEQWQFMPGAISAMSALIDAGFLLAVVTNQSGIGCGQYAPEDVEQLHSHMNHELSLHDIHVSAIAICPHRADDNCHCRKPATGMFSMIEDSIGRIDRSASWMVGDKPSDIEFGARLGVRTVLLPSAYWQASGLQVAPTMVCDDLKSAADCILRQCHDG